MVKQPTHSDLMKEIGELKKRLEKLEPKDELAPYRDLLDEIRKVFPQKEYIPYPYYPYNPNPWYPSHYPYWHVDYTNPPFICNTGFSVAGNTTTSGG